MSTFLQAATTQASVMMIVTNNEVASWLAQLGERQSAEWKIAGSNPSQTTTQGL